MDNSPGLEPQSDTLHKEFCGELVKKTALQVVRMALLLPQDSLDHVWAGKCQRMRPCSFGGLQDKMEVPLGDALFGEGPAVYFDQSPVLCSFALDRVVQMPSSDEAANGS